MTHPLDYYRGKDIAKELLIERINELQNMERNHIESARLNALAELLMEVDDVESRVKDAWLSEFLNTTPEKVERER